MKQNIGIYTKKWCLGFLISCLVFKILLPLLKNCNFFLDFRLICIFFKNHTTYRQSQTPFFSTYIDVSFQPITTCSTFTDEDIFRFLSNHIFNIVKLIILLSFSTEINGCNFRIPCFMQILKLYTFIYVSQIVFM